MHANWLRNALCLIIPLFQILAAASGHAQAANPGTVTIAHPGAYSAVYAVSDVHGMYRNLVKLLAENGITSGEDHWVAGKSLLVVVGDSIDKGPHSVDVIDLWMRLQKEAEAAGGRVVVLLGNHEAEFLANPTGSNEKADDLFRELKKRGMSVDELTDPKHPRARFLRDLPIAARVGNWVFCHSGLLPDKTWSEITEKASELLNEGKYGKGFITGDDSILQAKEWWVKGSKNRKRNKERLDREGLVGVVFGHQPKALGIPGRIGASKNGRFIKLDNGMAPEAGAHPGSLLVFPKPEELAESFRPGTLPQAFVLSSGQRKRLASESGN